MKVKNIMFTGFMAAILGATSANAAISVASQAYVDKQVKLNADAITEITKDSGTIDTKVAAAVAPLATAESVTDLQTSLDGRLDALEAIEHDTYATKEFVGTIPDTAEATNIVAYVQEKTAGIATDTALEELTGRVATAEGKVTSLEALTGENGQIAKDIADALQAAKDYADANDAEYDDTALVARVTANEGAISTIQGEQTAQNNKITALEGQFGETGTTTVAIKAAQDAADAAQDAADANAEAIEAINNAESGILAQAKSYADTQDAATLASAKSYADGKAAEEAGKVADTLNALATAEGLETCQADSGTCVLSYNGTAFAWTPLTVPVE